MNDKSNSNTQGKDNGQLVPNTKRGFQPAKNPPKMPVVKPPKRD